ncbi:MAG: 7,8-didemethyl-8-hydroxy-5-deazariboflavin synthase CofG [Pseudomonadota bacterium]
MTEHPLLADLARAPLPSLLAEASAIRDAHWGRTVTYSRKVFVPLTNMCRDTCGYCTFVKHPDDPAAHLMSPDEVRAIVRKGARQGCKEVLFSLGEKPELRYPAARAALAARGHSRLTDYLREMCALVLRESDLLPHVNAGRLSREELALLRPVAASMGMMLETLSRRLARAGGPHHACPDKLPRLRLRALLEAGAMRVPYTTGLLIGIGESFAERIEALAAIAEAHRRYGHVQEVIVQNFQRKPDIAMRDHPEPMLDDMLRTLAAARILLPAEISLQAPPNLSARHIDYLGAGINDWGGISPVTIDFINPGHDWPEIRTLDRACAEAGFSLRERLTIYPRLARPEFVDPGLLPAVQRLAGPDGLAAKATVPQAAE